MHDCDTYLCMFVRRTRRFGCSQLLLLVSVLVGSAGGMLVGVRMGEWLPPGVTSRLTASLTITIAVSLILVNMAKLLGLQD